LSEIENHPKLWIKESNNETGRFVVINHRGDKFEVFERDIPRNEWFEWEGVLLNQRKPKALEHFTRIVGYYSNLRNWNESKIAELDDRHKGIYIVPDNGEVH